MRPIRGASGHPSPLSHYQCDFTARLAPGIHGSTPSSADPYRNRPLGFRPAEHEFAAEEQNRHAGSPRS
jgi:hypothetical protein